MKTKLESFLLTGLKLVAALALVFGLTDTNNAMATSQFAKFQTGFTWADSGGSSLWGAATGGPYTATWTAGNDAVWETTAGSVTVNGATAQNITFNITGMTLAAGSGSLTLNGTTPTVSIASGSATISASLAGSAGLIKTGSGALTFGATSNSFTGGLTIKSGTLTAGNNRYVLGGNAGTGPVTLGDAAGGPATLVFNWNTYNNPITLGASAVGPLTLTDVGTANPLVGGGINLNGNNLNILKSGGNGANSALSIQTTAITGAGSLTLSNMNTAGNGTITISAPVGFTGAITNIGIGTNATLISGIISNTVTAVVQNSATAPLRLNNVGNSAFTGTITVNQGVLKTGNDAAVGLNGVLGSYSAVRQITVASGATLAFGNHDTFGGWANTPAVTLAINGTVTNSAGLGYVNALGPVTFNGGTLAASAGFASTGVYTNIAYALWSGGQVTVSGASTIALSGGAWLALQGIVPFSVAGGASLNVKGPLGNSPLPAAGGLSLSGGGTMMLQGTNTYTNTTTINAGTLLVNGSLAADSAVTVDGTASGILGGSGTINGTVTLQNGGALQPSTSGGVNTLTLANATAPSYGTGSKLTIRSSGTSLDRVICSAAAAHSLANVDLTIDCSGLSSPVSGVTIYSVASGDMSGTAFNSVTLANNLGGYTGTLHYNANGTVTVDLSAATYTVTYNANGGTGSQTDGNAYASGASVTVLGAGTMALANHTLIGWTNDGGTFYRPGGTFSMPANNVTLYAQWTTNNAGTGFNQTTAGWWDYNTTTNWVSDIINGTWDGALTLATNQTVTFATPTTLTTPLSFNYAGNYSLALKGVTAGTETLTLGGDISLNTSGGTNANVSIGDPVNHLNVALGATCILTVAANRTLTFSDPISGAGSGLIKAGGGTLVLGSTNAFTGGLIIKSGTVATRNIGNKTLGGQRHGRYHAGRCRRRSRHAVVQLATIQ